LRCIDSSTDQHLHAGGGPDTRQDAHVESLIDVKILFLGDPERHCISAAGAGAAYRYNGAGFRGVEKGWGHAVNKKEQKEFYQHRGFTSGCVPFA
jgi:hypothetical protein